MDDHRRAVAREGKAGSYLPGWAPFCSVVVNASLEKHFEYVAQRIAAFQTIAVSTALLSGALAKTLP